MAEKRDRIYLSPPGKNGVLVGPYRVKCGGKTGDSWQKIAKRRKLRGKKGNWLAQQARGRKGYA